jgi:hypothetical protein
VINIILDKSRTGGNIAFTGGQFYSKGAPLYQLDADYGFKLGDGGFIHFATEAKFHDRANSSAEPVPYILPRVNGQPDPRESTVDHVYAGGYGRSNRDVIVNSSYDAELPVGAVTLYSFSTFSYRDIKDARGAYIPSPTGYGGQANVLGSSVLPSSIPPGSRPTGASANAISRSRWGTRATGRVGLGREQFVRARFRLAGGGKHAQSLDRTDQPHQLFHGQADPEPVGQQPRPHPRL